VSKVNFKITPARIAEACNIVEYINLTLKDMRTVMIVSPRFVVKEGNEYYMTVKYDDDGDIVSYDGYADALRAMSQVTPKRLEKLAIEFGEAAENVVNPPNGTG
jgi:hypothetical protein